MDFLELAAAHDDDRAHEKPWKKCGGSCSVCLFIIALAKQPWYVWGSIPISRTAMEAKIPMIHSIRPCPNGWVLPPPYPATLKPRRDTRLVPASDRLLNPSAETATEWLSRPAAIFAMHKNRFLNINSISFNKKRNWPKDQFSTDTFLIIYVVS